MILSLSHDFKMRLRNIGFSGVSGSFSERLLIFEHIYMCIRWTILVYLSN